MDEDIAGPVVRQRASQYRSYLLGGKPPHHKCGKRKAIDETSKIVNKSLIG
jgi:hypothetical protein